jgi:hypothetical protein
MIRYFVTIEQKGSVICLHPKTMALITVNVSSKTSVHNTSWLQATLLPFLPHHTNITESTNKDILVHTMETYGRAAV